ncbi:MAG: hypothetical protein FJW85_08280 [Actinobacteria bacterium]|nr:hypothetical protein [Actinomycetota bacterium]
MSAAAQSGAGAMPGEAARSGPVGSSSGRAWRIAAPAVISVVTFLAIDLLLAALVGRPWGPAYPLSMDALVLLRMGPVFFSGLIVWPVMRARGATRAQAVVGILATPLAFAIVSGWRAAAFFPPLEAAYYSTNPMVVGAIGSQVSSAGVGALVYALWRARRHRSGRPVSSGATPLPISTGWSWGPIVAIIAGTALTVFAVIWDGGQHLFYPWVLLYGSLFG